MVCSILPKNKQKKFDLRYHSTVRSNFFGFLEELKTPKSPFEINWPLFILRFHYLRYLFTHNFIFFSRPDASTSVAVTTRKPKRKRKRPKRPRKKIKDRPRRKKKKNRKNRRRNRNRNRKNRRKNRRKSTTTTIPRLLGGTSFDRELTTPPTSL